MCLEFLKQKKQEVTKCISEIIVKNLPNFDKECKSTDQTSSTGPKHTQIQLHQGTVNKSKNKTRHTKKTKRKA